MNTVMAEMYGKAEGCSGGRGGSMHLFDAATEFYGGNAIVGGGLPLAGGLALADRMRARTVSRPVSSATARWRRASSTRR
jgi:2-oxoisovalerate dehydrogenase E1 component